MARRRHGAVILATLASCVAVQPHADEFTPPPFNTYGLPGLLDMPTARPAPDATIGVTFSKFGNTNRNTLFFQATPRLSGSLRYSGIDNFDSPGSVNGRYYDRSFDLRFQLLNETDTLPGVAVGLQDFIGTGLYGGEYVVATKEVIPGLNVTGGLGWGRLGSHGSFASTGKRPEEILGEGGIPTYDRWFRGDVAPFGGISYSPNEHLTFKAEYSSDNYDLDRDKAGFDGTSQWNYGIDYRFSNGTQLSFYHMYGTEFGAQLSVFANPRNAPIPGGGETAPSPVKLRGADARRDLGWTEDTRTIAIARGQLIQGFERDGLKMEGLYLEPTRATVRMENERYEAPAEAVGRAARTMSRVLPGSVENFVIVPVDNGIELSAIHLRRSDIEALENAKGTEMLARAAITDSYGLDTAVEPDLYPRFDWSIGPDIDFSFFDPDNPLRLNLNAKVTATYRITPNLVLSGAVSKKVVGNLDTIERESNSELPHVRTDYDKYAKQGDPSLDNLTLAYYGHPARDIYSRVTAGYLESMYAGVSGELLWMPVDSRLALGGELNYARKRDFDKGFGLQDYDVVTGHASAYYAFGNGYHGQLDVGRYLAGDYGATISIDREFANGWKVGAFATFTDVPFDDFGEGSFDKGIRISLPLSWALGKPTTRTADVTLRSLTRDGGARLNVGGRLYGKVREYHRPELERTWGKFWR